MFRHFPPREKRAHGWLRPVCISFTRIRLHAKQSLFQMGLDDFTVKIMGQKVQSRMETSPFPGMCESKPPGVSCPWVKDRDEFSYAKSVT